MLLYRTPGVAALTPMNAPLEAAETRETTRLETACAETAVVLVGCQSPKPPLGVAWLAAPEHALRATTATIGASRKTPSLVSLCTVMLHNVRERQYSAAP